MDVGFSDSFRRRWSAGIGLLLAVVLAAGNATAIAPDAAAHQRSLDLREQWMHLTQGVAFPARWIDAERFQYRRTALGGFEFVVRHVGATEARPAFDHDRLATALGVATGKTYDAKRLPFEDFEFIEDGAAIRVWVEGRALRCGLGENNACAVVPGNGTNPRPRAFGVVRDLSVPADNTPRRSPDGRYEAFAQGDNLALREVASGEVRVLSRDGSPGDFYDPETLVWSPDSRRLALYRVRPGHRREVRRVESAPRDQVHARVHTQLYPKPGDPVDIERPMIFEAGSGRQVTVPTGHFPNAFRLSPLYFREDGRTLAFRYVERGHQRVRLIEIEADSGATRVAIEESSSTFVNDWWHRSFFHDVGNHGREIVWMSERDGWNHLYLFDGSNGRARQLTRGEWVVRRVLHVDEERREVWFVASGRELGDPYLQHVYRVDFSGRNLHHMTPAGAWHEVSLSPDQRYYVDTWSRVNHPTVSELRDARDGRLIAELERGDIGALEAAGFRYPETFVAPGRDGRTPIHGLIVRPTDYDPARRYPVIESIYAGPHDSFVPKTFWPFGRHSSGDKAIGMQALADLGFIVVQIDGMGTMNRSKAFHDVAWKNLGDSGFPDRIAWHRAQAARDPSYDLSRGVGIYGASAGGQSALGALLFHPDFYTVAVAYNGCYDNRMDKISWNEQWMGWPVDESYARASGVDNAHRLQGRLLMILGEQDENVDPASTYQVADALIRAGKDFELLVLPGEGHSVGRSDGPISYVQRRQLDFFVRHLLGQPTPDWNRPASL
ncbi:prolyl oligopeptidase family serine peptidase [Lysobacter alkalisoli]|uniref:Prolyl oligopeptidase family serine peptidase n=2 Tax=Marilutibacter alkalisoli TaxID=2591633 RepID=A0A514BR77_9GAMM|nr:S9 family peptidase [Lysobacter alkalisoli]QDH69887.1 prolyl oligopeptidase family serine peptidase [Lysobacter alkalisoli]